MRSMERRIWVCWAKVGDRAWRKMCLNEREDVEVDKRDAILMMSEFALPCVMCHEVEAGRWTLEKGGVKYIAAAVDSSSPVRTDGG